MATISWRTFSIFSSFSVPIWSIAAPAAPSIAVFTANSVAFADAASDASGDAGCLLARGVRNFPSQRGSIALMRFSSGG